MVVVFIRNCDRLRSMFPLVLTTGRLAVIIVHRFIEPVVVDRMIMGDNYLS